MIAMTSTFLSVETLIASGWELPAALLILSVLRMFHRLTDCYVGAEFYHQRMSSHFPGREQSIAEKIGISFRLLQKQVLPSTMGDEPSEINLSINICFVFTMICVQCGG